MNLLPIFSKMFAEGSYGGQCGAFAHKLYAADAHFPLLGVFLSSKKAELLRSGFTATPQVGDILLMNYPLNGHLAVINGVGAGCFQLTESNFNYITKPLRVSHKRLIPIDSPLILGFWRGTPLYTVPPKVLQVKVVQKGDPWSSMGDKYAEIRKRLLTYTNGRIDINLDTAYITQDPPFVSAGYPANKGVLPSWYDANVLPLCKGYDVACLLTPRQDFTSFGWFSVPNKIQIFTDENWSTGGSTIETMNHFVYVMLHELSHFLYSQTGQVDVTHIFLNDGQPPCRDMKTLFSLIDYSKL